MKDKLATPLLNSFQNQNNMKSKKIYRIELTEVDSIFKDMVLDAAMSNGGKYVSLHQLEESAKFLCRKFPATGSQHTVNLMGNILTIDKGTENIVVITEVEILDLELPQITKQEAKDLLEELAPTLHRAGTGIDDKEAHENLN